MKNPLLAAGAFAGFMFLSPPANAGDCEGGSGLVLEVPNFAPIGSTVDVHMTGIADDLGLFMLSLGDGPLKTPYGTLCIDFPLVFSLLFTFDGNGNYSISGDIPCDPAFVDLTVYMQFISCHVKTASNQESLTITDGFCDGDFATFTQGGWGATCKGKNPGCRRDKWFSTVFPKGVILGDGDGVDGDGEFALHFTSSAAVEAFLPAGSTPDVLDADATDPTSSSAGVFGGQLLAARLNLAFDDAGAFDDLKSRDDLKLGDLVFVAGVDADLIGWSVRDLIDLADDVISGAAGSGPFDLDGNGSDDVTVADLSGALEVINENFDDGLLNNGNLGIP